MFNDSNVRLKIAPLGKNELRAVAHHEAGHAVAAMVRNFWRPIELVVVGRHISDVAGGLVEGFVRFGNENAPYASLPRDQLITDAVLSWAGPLAEIRDQQHRKNRELENLEHYWLKGGAKGDSEAARYACIEAAARDLSVDIDTLDYVPLAVNEAANKLYDDTFRQAKKLVEDYWHYIRKLAIMLQQRGKVTGEEIWDLFTTPDQQEAA